MMPQKTAPAGSPTTVVKISRRGATRLKEGHVWVYRSDVLAADAIPPGALVQVVDERGRFVGSALYSTSSQIAIRLLSREPVDDLESLLRDRIQAAIAYRERFVSNSDAYRVVFSEADSLPGFIVDRYNDLLCIQILTQAMDSAPIRRTMISELQRQLRPAAIADRVEPRIRSLEQLPARSSGLVCGDKTSTIFSMNDVRFHYNALEGQKTGAFLDQRENYAAAATYAHGDCLDVFCYQGGFALHFAPCCSSVTGVDSSRPALEVADRNASLNGRELEWIEANAFDLLRDYAEAKRQYDTIVLDPPPFARTRRDLNRALRAYKELNLRALKLLRPGGILVTCSCSYHVKSEEFLGMLAEAAQDVHRNLYLLENRAQAKDHPILLQIPETAYLKCVIVNVSS
jgi:23S rRNA (cytosine1962-C5)-methyltransferase